jgi:serine/threonine protein kinase
VSYTFASTDAVPTEPSDPPDYVRGQVLRGKYELLRRLDSGGMGVVWIARDRVLNVEVALKLMQRAASEREEFTRRALSEARLAAKLAHPAVCRAVDFGLSERGDPFVVSELLTGESLEERITRAGSMTPVEAVQMLLPILDALRAAHELGIVHRDVKPGNVFLAKQLDQAIQPKLLDFGIARWLDEAGGASEGICGTPCYMSPEQARGGGDVDARSDIWNFCATLYELCTGVPPFDGETGAEVIAAVQNVDPPPITAYRTGDDELAAIIARGMRRNRDERWASAEELNVALSRWLLAHGAETDGSGRSLRARLGEPLENPIMPVSLSPATLPVTGSTPTPAELQAASKRFWLGVLAGAALVLPLTSFQVLRAQTEAASMDAERASSLPAVADGTKTSVAAAVPPSEEQLALTTLASTEVTPRVEVVTTQPEPEPAPTGARVRGPQVSVTTPAPAPTATATSASATPTVAQQPAVPARTPAPRAEPRPKRASNALGYDFGF